MATAEMPSVRKRKSSENSEKSKKSKKVKVTQIEATAADVESPRVEVDEDIITDPQPKKEKKSKARKSSVTIAVEASPAPEEFAVVEASPEPISQSNGKKRKRDLINEEEELEIDVSLPEPLSKKAARKAKKTKISPAKTNGDSNPLNTKQPAKDEEKPERRTGWGIWIGNLPWTATKQELRDFICSTGSIKPTEITRVHMPAPDSKAPTRGDVKNHNKGFAYVDFDSPEGLDEALKMSETAMDSTHRKVLIKNANNFEGRPEKKTETAAATTKFDNKSEKPTSKRIFIGNLAFDTTKEDLEIHFSQCGGITDLHMATFEDTGKCKGFAWVTFDSEESSTKAVQGYIYKRDDDPSSSEDEDVETDDAKVESSNSDSDAKPKKPTKEKTKKAKKPRKWYINKLHGRILRTEFAEDPSVRYKKRYGKDAPGRRAEETNHTPIDIESAGLNESGRTFTLMQEVSDSAPKPSTPHERRREARRSQKEHVKVDARLIKPGAALANAQRATGAIVEAKGSKITFE